eukprot:TRINITY_DN8228_c0_g1_i1.p1 TRINITY_DN8228_c0_g1~~TRINITY_DN8228_c0_g1_i1.p1  ORF type:complete len:729 (-),score=97.74 TRINITY_DN8228_c0_g1_i1:22-2055(-)
MISASCQEYGLTSFTLCLRFDETFPVTPPFVRITFPIVNLGNSPVFNDARQSFTQQLWQHWPTTGLSVIQIVQTIRECLENNIVIVEETKSNLKKIVPALRYIPKQSSTEIKLLQEEAKIKRKANTETEKTASPLIDTLGKYKGSEAAEEIRKVQEQRRRNASPSSISKTVPATRENIVPLVQQKYEPSTDMSYIRDIQETRRQQKIDKERLRDQKVDEIVSDIQVSITDLSNGLPIPTEVQSLVFGYLSFKDLQRVQSVCKAWNKSCWALTSLRFVGTEVRKDTSKRYFDYLITKIHPGRISKLKLGQCNFDPTETEKFSQLTNLQSFKWSHVISDECLSYLSSFTNLRKLVLSKDTQPSDPYYYAYNRMGAGFNIMDPNPDGDDDGDDDEEDSIHSSDNEQNMEQEDQNIETEENKPNFRSLEMIASRLLHLEVLRLPKCGVIHVEPLRSLLSLRTLDISYTPIKKTQYNILSTCTQLTSLNLSHAKHLSSSTLRILADGLSKTLQCLDISECTNVGSADALSAFTELKELSLEGLSNMDFSNLWHLKKLEKLNMALTGKHVIETIIVISKLSQLKWLNLHGCQHFKENLLKPLTSLQQLLYLDITSIMSLSSIGCLTSLQNLTVLRLNYCRSLSNISPLFEMSKLMVIELRGIGLMSTQLERLKETHPHSSIIF